MQEYAAFIEQMHQLAMVDVPKTSLGISTPPKLQRTYRNVYVLTYNLPVDPNGRYTDFLFVEGFDQRIELMKGITRPRRVVCFGGNGQRYIQLIKGKDPPRQDATTVQLFDLLNELFARRALTHHLHILSFWPTCVCLVAAVREHCDPITIVLEVFVVRSFKRGKATQQAITPGALSWLA